MRAVLFLFLLACCVGCSQLGGGGGLTVSGKITFPDGVGVTDGEITFSSRLFTAGGTITSGTYSISTRVPVGTYRVSVRIDETVPATDGAPPRRLIDPKYSDPATSGLTVEVREGGTFDITVTAPQQ